MFSIRNGFGGKCRFPPITSLHCDQNNIQKAAELRQMLLSLSGAEEAAIRQITPLLTIVKLSEGNIGTKGSSHLVWQKSNLSLILPNLPVECKFVIIKRRNSSNTSVIQSTKFERWKIQRVLELLSESVPGVWSPSPGFEITYSRERLEQWPESGDLAELNVGLNIHELDEDNILHDNENCDDDIPEEGLRADGADVGPAPLQNAEAPDEEFETAVNYAIGSATANADNSTAAVAGRIDAILGGQNYPQRHPTTTDTATFEQPSVLQTDGFVDMSKTPYAWARAFPTVFIPEYIPVSSSEYAWVIRHDITGWYKIRDKKVDSTRWYEYMMWRHDGLPAKHPTFSLALYNYKTSISLQQVGRHVINTSSIDPTITIGELRNADDDDTIHGAVKELVKKTHLFSSSVPGTPRYWTNTASEFFSIAEYNSHIHDRVPNFFITNSLADHHEYHLRLVLHNYLLQIHDNCSDSSYCLAIEDSVLNSDNAFSKAAHTYKNVVTHYFASKVEVWYALVLYPLLGIDLAMLVHEFQTSRGAIHCHVSGYSSHEESWQQINDELFKYSITLHDALVDLDVFLQITASEDELRDLQLDCAKGGMTRRKRFLERTNEGKERWRDFLATLKEAETVLDSSIGHVLETEYGYSAMHHGLPPQHWVKPGGQPGQNYRSSTRGMLSSKDVLEARELKHLKLQREDDPLLRRINLTNHCLTHKCSDYCWKLTVTYEKYNPGVHSQEQLDTCSLVDEDGQIIIKVETKECRMGFGYALRKDFSGEKNLTGGAEFRAQPAIVFDRNQMPKFLPRRNHPRLINHPHSALYFGANNDIQPILINSSSMRTMEHFDNDPDQYAYFFRNMNILARGGLEHHNGLYTVLKYMTGYQCKGGKSTQAWETAMHSLTTAYCSNLDNEHKSLRSLIGKHMHDLPKSISISRDQSQFLLGGGMLKRTSIGQIRRCSVSSEFLESFGDDENKTSFNWRNICHHYKNRNATLSNISLYRFCCCHWPYDSQQKPVQFFGFHDQATWPLDDAYSKWILTIYYPWLHTPEELQLPTYADFLTKNYTSSYIPHTIQANISRARNNVRSVDTSDSYLNTGGVREIFTPTTGRTDDRLNDAIETEHFFNNQHRDYEDLSDDQFNRLPDPEIGSLDWRKSCRHSENYNIETAMSWLVEERVQFYETMESTDDSDTVCQFPIQDFCPENAKGKKQVMIVYILLYQLYRYHVATQSGSPTPPSIFMFAEGLPGTGKSRMLKTMRNIVRLVRNSNTSELTSAPTGVAASLINATTHCRSCYIPTGKDFSKAPVPIASTKSNTLRHLVSLHSNLFLRAFDEHSMTGRRSFAWLKHRLEELRKPAEIYDAAGNLLPNNTNHTSVPFDVSSRPFGGVPFIFSCGDHAQLPPVLDKLLYDMSPGKVNSADLCGKIAFSQFLNPEDASKVESAVVILDEVLRQDDPVFLGFLSRMRDGTMNVEDVDLIRSRCFEALDPSEKALFKDAIHLTSTWEEASQVAFRYLCRLNSPIAKIRARYLTSRNDSKNCCLREKSYPTQIAIGVGAVVMLLKNFIVEEWHILNGSIGTVVDIIYDHTDGPMAQGNPLPFFVVVDFPCSNVPEDKKCFPHLPRSYVAIPVIHERCERKCCSIETVPLRVCVAITIYKSQGITVGKGEQFEHVVVHLPLNSKRVVPGLELVAFSRAKSLDCIAVGNPASDLVTDRILKIGKTKSNKAYKDFMNMLSKKEQETFQIFETRITALDSNRVEGQEPTFQGGCDFLLQWYHSMVDSSLQEQNS
jgi:hypothetical protein